VQRAATAAAAHATWQNARRFTPDQQEAAHLVGKPSIERLVGDAAPAFNSPSVVRATYSRPYVAHASIAPSCALAEYRGGHLTVWSHTQGVYPLRQSLANVLGIDRAAISVRHAHGAGCYGHNGADDVALDAALIAMRMPDRCIRVQWRREEEFAFEPFGTAMSIGLTAELDSDGRPTAWQAEIWAQRSGAFDVVVPFQFSVPTISLRFSELSLSSDANPYGIVVDKNGVIWFAETGSGNLARYEPTTATFSEFSLSPNRGRDHST
jgi:CO/xanthine dehydrogenase Mo-binding subunit